MLRASLAIGLGVTLGMAGSIALANPPAMQMAMPMAGPPATIADWGKGARLFDGMARAHRAIATTSAEAQRYFDQGMSLLWGFNHDEAARSFAHAAELDPHCAACYWGLSLAVGPNYNLPFLTAERGRVAYAAAQRAVAEAGHGTPVEQALIGALVKRYPRADGLDADHLLPVLTDYATALGQVAHAYPNDLDIQTLYAEALMNLHAWKLWSADGTPAPGTLEIVAILRGVLARDPAHVGANHYLIHALEASPHPGDALVAAEALKNAAPGEGHLLHMPSHIQQRVGLYEAAAEANRRGVKADLDYARLTTAPDYYGMYTGHNYQFLAFSAATEGRRAETIDAVEQSHRVMPDAMLMQMPGVDWYVAEMYAARVRFGLWDQLLAMPAPDPAIPGLRAGYLYGLGMAQAATGNLAGARASLAGLKALQAMIPADTGAGQNLLKDTIAVAIPTVEARIARAEHRTADEIGALRASVVAEDKLSYDEPRDWFVSTRQVLGEALLRSGAAAEAEQVYRDDLARTPGNGWALKGLALALAAQSKTDEARKTDAAFQQAWSLADTPLQASAF